MKVTSRAMVAMARLALRILKARKSCPPRILILSPTELEQASRNEKASRSLLGRLAFSFSLIAELPSLLKEAGATVLLVLWLRPENRFQLAGCSELGRRNGRRASSSTL